MRNKLRKNHHVGTITLGPILIVSDPAYDRSTSCAAWNIKIKPGQYNCSAVVQKEGRWGDRVAEIKILKTEFSSFFGLEEIETSFDIGVDSGQAGFFDDSIYPILSEGADKHKNPEFDYYHEGGFFNTICALTYNPNDRKQKFGIGFGQKGFVSSSGFGDGSYNLYLYKNGNDVVGAKIVFIGDEDDEESD